MRYRPFGATGKAVSAISLLLREAPNMNSPAAWRALAFSAMENGVNSFELTAGSDVLAMGVGEALTAVERRLIFLGWRLRGTTAGKMTARDIAGLERLPVAARPTFRQIAQAVEAWFAAREPEDARQNPVPFRLESRQFGTVDFTSGPAPDKDRIFRLAGADPGTDEMLAARRAVAAAQLARPSAGRGHKIAADFPPTFVKQGQRLPGN